MPAQTHVRAIMLTAVRQMTRCGQSPIRVCRRFLTSLNVFLSEIHAADSLASCRLDLYSAGIEPRKLVRADLRCSINKLQDPPLCFPTSPPPPTSAMSWSRLSKRLAGATTWLRPAPTSRAGPIYREPVWMLHPPSWNDRKPSVRALRRRRARPCCSARPRPGGFWLLFHGGRRH